MEKLRHRTWYYHEACAVYGYELLKLCWNCESTDVIQKAPGLKASGIGVSIAELNTERETEI